MTVGTAAAFAGLVLAATVHPVRVASPLTGRVLFNGHPVPGATVVVTRSEQRHRTLSTADGMFRFAALDEGEWMVRVEMRGFVPSVRTVSVSGDASSVTCELTMQSYAQITAHAARQLQLAPPPEPVPTDADIELISGSVSNGAATPFAQPPAFGNNRQRGRPRYNGGFTVLLGNSAWNARPFSFGGRAPAPLYSDVQIGGTLMGPLRIPGLVQNGPQFTLSYQHGRLHTATTQSARMPTEAQRRGDFSSVPSPVRDPITGRPFADNVIPADRIAPQALALLAYYPRPNASTSRGANYDKAIVASTVTDALHTAATRTFTRSSAGGSVLFQRSATDSNGLFNFTDRTEQSTLDAQVNWTRRVTTRVSVRARYRFGRTASALLPFFAGRVDVSGDAGIRGGDPRSENWGPPTLTFPDLAGLRDVQYQRSVNTRHGGGIEFNVRRGRHNVTVGGDTRWNGYAIAAQPDPRGTLAFTGAITGQPFGDFLLGLPSTSTVGFAQRTAHLAGLAYDLYVTDDWRLSRVTLTLGARYEFEPPLDRALQPDRSGIEPRLAASWRPVPGSSLVIRSGYGVYRNAGVYQPLAQLLAYQPPLARTLSVQSTASTPLTLAEPFPSSIPSARTFVVDPGFRAGYAHNWFASMQRDLPGSLTGITSYLGARGSRLMQATLPNTYPAGGIDPCPACPSGYVLVTSHGSSLRSAAQLTLRRRLHNGFTATAQYTLATATDDAATFSGTAVSPHNLSIAQDWRDPGAERSASTFDQRHLLTVQGQFTSGGGKKTTLTPGLLTRVLKDWTIGAQLAAGSGLPVTPILFAAIGGSGFAGMRPQLTGAPTGPAASDSYANAAAYAAPAPGTWGNAPRHSIRGPAQFSLDASLSRAFPVRGSATVEARVSASNVLNRVTYSAIDAIVTSPQFGLPVAANPMRRLQATLRFRF